jgi:hypothetical protein
MALNGRVKMRLNNAHRIAFYLLDMLTNNGLEENMSFGNVTPHKALDCNSRTQNVPEPFGSKVWSYELLKSAGKIILGF